jgi:uncharacterized membrane protein YhaH (DUF805 family)
MIEAVKVFFRNYTNFEGRSTRADYWWVMLASFIFGFCLGFVAGLLKIDPKTMMIVEAVIALAMLIPSLALSVRRLHDINKSGWFLLIAFIPAVGGIILFIFTLLPSVEEGNSYGPRAE